MAAEPLVCRLCGAERPESIGALPDGDFFAGRVLAQPLAGGGLWRCRKCESMFRHPVLEADGYRRLYECGAAEQWHGSDSRCDLQLIRDLIAARPKVQSVLDVGCGTGAFVASLPGGVAKFGIEPAVDAARLAASRGVVIASGSLEELPPGQCFDVITFIDVIEHVPEPTALLQLAARHLNPDGVIVVASADPQSAAWRWFGARFWYSTYPEHVSFPSLRFFEPWVVQRNRIRYERLPVSKWLFRAVVQLGYWLSPTLFHRAGRMFMAEGSGRRFFSPSAPGVFVDHQVVVLSGAALEQEVGLNGAR